MSATNEGTGRAVGSGELAGVRVSKAHGTGNDFVVCTDRDGTLDVSAETVASVCDRHTGLGGLDQMVSNVRPSGTSCGRAVSTPVRPRDRAFSAVSWRLRWLTSTAVTRASGAAWASAIVIGPHPQPMSSRSVPCGSGTVRSSAAVPLSRSPGENTPAAVTTSTCRPRSSTPIRRRFSGRDGSETK